MGAPESLLQRRARFIYGAGRLFTTCSGSSIVPPSWFDRDEGWRATFLGACQMQMSENRAKTPEESHDRWVEHHKALGWTLGPKHDPKLRTHPNLKPWHDLPKAEQEKDRVFMALCVIAEQAIT